MFSYEKRACLARAKLLAANGSLESLVYAALELRLCIEAISYEKLKLYAPRLPDEVLRRWQPPQILKALLEYEPNADETFELSIGGESPSGSGQFTYLGNHVSFKYSELQKIYNKLGNFLHSPTFSEHQFFDYDKRKDELNLFLKGVFPRIEEIANSRVDCSIATTFTFECFMCGSPVIRNLGSLLTKPDTVCLNPSCKAEYWVDTSKQNPEVHLKATSFKCLKCGSDMRIENRRLEIGNTVKCDDCNSVHVFAQRHWAYGLRE